MRSRDPSRPARAHPLPVVCRMPPGRRSGMRALTIAVRAWSAKSLNIRGHIANVVGRQPFRDGRHHVAGSGWAGAGGIVIQLLDDVDRFLAAQCRKFGGLVAAAAWTMAGQARRDAASLVAASIECFSGFPESR